MSTEIIYTIILMIASLSSALIMHFIDKNNDGKIDKEEIEEVIIDNLKKD